MAEIGELNRVVSARRFILMADEWLQNSGGCSADARLAGLCAARAIHQLRNVPNVDSELWKASRTRAEALIATGEFDRAVRWLEECTEKIKDPSEARILLGKVLLLAGCGKAAVAELERVGSARSQTSQGLKQKLGLDLAILLGRSMDASAQTEQMVRDRAVKLKAAVLSVLDDKCDYEASRAAFILQVVDAKVALAAGFEEPAFDSLQDARKIELRIPGVAKSVAYPEYLALKGEVALLRGRWGEAATTFEQLSCVFCSAEDAPNYFKRSIWGLFEAYSAQGKIEKLASIEGRLARRSRDLNGVFGPWAEALGDMIGGYIDGEFDTQRLGDILRESQGRFSRGEWLVLSAIRAGQMTRSGDVNQVRAGVFSLEVILNWCSRECTLSERNRIARLVIDWYQTIEQSQPTIIMREVAKIATENLDGLPRFRSISTRISRSGELL